MAPLDKHGSVLIRAIREATKSTGRLVDLYPRGVSLNRLFHKVVREYYPYPHEIVDVWTRRCFHIIVRSRQKPPRRPELVTRTRTRALERLPFLVQSRI
ncbi:hypothetical protein L596_028950 [Steinernema carpocapsae]|uniref:Uncharacterized protein n=1 Tax=Steinernema carpocapsae TaxID=34508 RepID=A0A4U5LZV0_STECR|nr:hypothetical protein L596_028950 [Steinernema carpocapsae]